MSHINDITDIWEMVKESFHQKLSQVSIDLWFGDLKIVSFEDDVLTFSTDSEYKLSTIQNKYMDMLSDAFASILGFEIEIKIQFDGTPVDVEQIKRQLMGNLQRKKSENEESTPGYTFHFEYTFDNFIVGDSNKFAHAACTAVADRPAMDYNPLFIYGPSGLGKTHLMNAVINEIKRKKSNLKVLYVKGEDFTNQLIESLSKQEMPQFRARYRNCDILLIDDIQFIAGKNSTQEEFFHTFNTLYEEHKQIILSSDRPPKDIQTLEERLKTRFEWGLIADIEPPDLELRVAIIKKKAEQINITLTDEVLNFLAENLCSNIRQIEGAVRKLSALSFLTGKTITMETARSCLSELLGGSEPINITLDKIFTAVYKKYNVKKEDIIGNKRTKEIAAVRHTTIYLIRRVTEMSFPSIGKIFNRDHATIMASNNQIEKKIHIDPIFNIEIEEMIKEIMG